MALTHTAYGEYGSGMAGVSILLTLLELLIAAGVYVWVGFALMTVFRKAGIEAWKAWVPVVNSWYLFVLGRMRGWWSIVSIGSYFVVALVNGILGAVLIGAAVGAAVQGSYGAATAAGAAAAIVSAVLWLALAAFLVVLEVRMLIGVNRGFGLGAGYTVLGVFLFPVWASVVAWGSARWQGGPVVPARPVAGPAAPAAYGYAPPPPPPGPSGAPAASGSPAPTGYAVPPVPAAPPVPPPPPSGVAGPSAGAAAPSSGAAAASGYPAPPAYAPPAFPPPPAPPAPQPAFPPAPATAAFPPVPPAPPAPPAPAATPPVDVWAPQYAPPAEATVRTASAVPESVAGPSALEADDEATVLTPKRRPATTLSLPDGSTVTLVADVVLLGRNPAPTADTVDAQLVVVADPTKTISKTHALLRRTVAGWSIEDLGSTNGVALTGPDGAEIVVEGVAPVTVRFLLGDAELRISDEA